MATTIHDILDELRTSATSERDKGDKFERLIQAYFKTDLMYANQYSDVWLWASAMGSSHTAERLRVVVSVVEASPLVHSSAPSTRLSTAASMGLRLSVADDCIGTHVLCRLAWRWVQAGV